jgi:hypothetical protein
MTRSPPCAETHQHICSPGKTTFLKFMLAQLVSADQVVLLCTTVYTHLFYSGCVYTRPTEFGFEDLPRFKGGYYPVWALIDTDFRQHGPPVGSGSINWPIQASSPKPIQWKQWSKQFGATLLGMPQWNMKELIAGYVFSLFSLSVINPGHTV